jgi:D-alanyl-D-alanine carboxypeptidase (penicillin-binding protein 5/6)
MFTLGRGEESKVTVGFTPAVKYLVAPVAPGEHVGDLAVMLDGKPQSSIPIVTRAGVARAGFFGRLTQRIGRWL